MSVAAVDQPGDDPAPRGWEALWQRDRWPHDLLPTVDPDSEQRGYLRFDGIRPNWLREAAKRWTRARLLSGTTFGSMRVYVRDLVIFSEWLTAHAPEVRRTSGITRAVLEDYLLWVRQSHFARASRRRQVSVVRQFLPSRLTTGLPGYRAARSSTSARSRRGRRERREGSSRRCSSS